MFRHIRARKDKVFVKGLVIPISRTEIEEENGEGYFLINFIVGVF